MTVEQMVGVIAIGVASYVVMVARQEQARVIARCRLCRDIRPVLDLEGDGTCEECSR